MHRLHNYSCATSLRISIKPFSNYNTNCKITILYIKHTCKNVTVCALITSESAFSSYQHFAFFIGQFWKNWISAYMWFKMHFTLFKEKLNKNNPNNAIYLGDFYGGGGDVGDNPDSFKSFFTTHTISFFLHIFLQKCYKE